MEGVDREELNDTEGARENHEEQDAVEMPFPIVVETGDEYVGTEKENPKEKALIAAAVSPEGFVKMRRQQCGDADFQKKKCENDITLCEMKPFNACLQ